MIKYDSMILEINILLYIATITNFMIKLLIEILKLFLSKFVLYNIFINYNTLIKV